MRAEVFGPYVVYEQIGMGGMATVHRAETQGVAGFSKQVALKRMLPSVAADPNLVQSFIREARLASYLRHANVAQTYDLGKVGDTYFIAMELVPGRNLLQILKHCATVAGHMPLPIAMNIVNQIADALDYAHNLCDEAGQPLGIIHRDVSPANVIVSEGGVVKLIDFGIAKASKASGMATMSGTIKGKFSYMAPENLYGHADARSDLFALGVIAHELLSNRPLLQGKDDMDTLYRVRDMPILPPSRINPEVPPEIDAIIMTALERDPDKRWQRATAMRQALTLETQRLGLVAHNYQVYEWIERAFQQPVREDSEPSIVISSNTVELAKGTVPDEFSDPSDSLATQVAKNALRSAPAQAWPASGEHTQAEPHVFDVPTVSAPAVTFDVPTVAGEPDARILAATKEWNSPATAETRYDRPRLSSSSISPHVVPRARASSSEPPVHAPATRVPSPGQTLLGTPAPRARGPDVLDAGETAVDLPASTQIDTAVDAAPLVHADPVGLGTPGAVRAAASEPADHGEPPPRPRKRTRKLLLALFVIVTAGGAAAVVYFALPYFTR